MPQHSMAPMLFGLRVVMLGRQGSGKGTQGVQLARLLVVPHISVGDVLREAAKHLLGGAEIPSRNVELGCLGLRYRQEAKGGIGWYR